MGKIFILFILGILISCSHKEKVLYEELTPDEFTTRLAKCPVAYLPLGTLEWHGVHLPLGADGLQSQEFFKLLAQRAGGIVLPMIFFGPDMHDPVRDSIMGDKKYYGMDYSVKLPSGKYQPQQLIGSAYWIPDITFHSITDGIMNQLSRAGFKIVIAHGHSPSIWLFKAYADDWMQKYSLKVITCWGDDTEDLCLMCDHAAANETSIMMAVRPDLVQMGNLPKDTTEWPLGIAGKDPRIYASRKLGEEIIDFEINKMVAVIQSELKKLK